MSGTAKHVDVEVHAHMPAPPERVAGVMFDPAREPDWMAAVKAAGWLDAPLALGSRAWQKGRFLGKEIGWTTKVVEHTPERSLRLQIEGGPFRGTVHYAVQSVAGGSDVSVRNEGTPTAFTWMPAWLVAAAMRGAMRADLRRLRRLLQPDVAGDVS